MNGNRIWTIAGQELRTHLTGPLLWVLLMLMVVLTMSLNPTAMIPTDDTVVGGIRAYVNSPYALAQFFSLAGIFLYPFFVSIMAGLSVIRDDEVRVAELLHSSPLTSAEYIIGKFSGVLAALGLVVLLHLAFAIWHLQLAPIDHAEALRGPFRLINFAGTMLLFGTPGIVFCAGLAFAVGERTRSPMAVYAVPIFYFLGVTFFLWSWNPSWLAPGINQALMVLDPSALRWLRQTLFAVDRGVAFYNTAPLALDATFVANRIITLAVPLLAIIASIRHCGLMIGGDPPVSRWFVRSRKQAQAPPAGAPDAALTNLRPLRDLGMTTTPPGFLRSTWHIAQTELRELRGQPTLYLFIPFIIFIVLDFATAESGILDAPTIQTAGFLAIGTIEIITVLVCLLLLFYTVESVNRERLTGFDAICYATPFQTGALLLAKSLANAVIVTVILLVCFATSLSTLAGQSQGRMELWPFVLVWGLLLAPTFFIWNTFVTAVLAVVRNRYTTYALGLSALLLTAYGFQSGNITWVLNWPLWGTLRWSDMGTFPLNGEALFLNRLLMLAIGVFFVAVALMAFARTDRDATTTLHRFRPRAVFRTALRLAPFALLPLLLGSYLFYQIDTGFQGQAAQDRAKAYWRQNVATWKDFIPPQITDTALKVRLEPAAHRLEMAGTFKMVNHTDAAMPLLPFTVGQSFEDVTWALNGIATDAEDRADLQVLTPSTPLLPGDTVTVGFAYRAVYPKGFTRNGDGLSHFILSSGVLLSTLRGEFLPTPGFVEHLGLDEDNRYDAPTYPDDFWQETLPPIGQSALFNTRVEVTAPRAYTVTSIGVKTAAHTQEGQTTVVWESDHPVQVVNLMAGQWAAQTREGNAIYYHPGHPYNIDEMMEAMVAARTYYSAWFYPYPWQELRINEFPNVETNATGFPTNISFSESAGFLTKRTSGKAAVFTVTAHEVAHQWWGNLLRPGEGPGADILIEGAAHYATLLLHEAVHGLRSRIAFATQIEASYDTGRRVDAEKPLVRMLDDGRPADATVIYNKGAWVLWMLHNHLGADRMQAGLQAFFRRYLAPQDEDYPALQDFIETLRPFAADSAGYQHFVDQWFFDVVLPEYTLTNADIVKKGDQWTISATVENLGTGTATIEVAAMRGERFQGNDAAINPDYAEARTTVRLEPGRPQRISLQASFAPQQLVIDPDALVLQRNRNRTLVTLDRQE